MNFNPFKRSSKGGSKNTLGKILHDFAEMQPNSVNCSLLPADPRSEAEPEDLERAFIFKHGGQVLVKNKAFYITTPDGFRAEDDHMSKGAILHLWFLYNRVPYTIDTRVMGRIRFPDAFLDDLAPRIPVAYMLQPVGNIRKIENRQYLRYAHKVGHGGTRVYTQLLFDLYVTKTDISFPDTGSLPPNITDIHTIPYIEKTEIADQPPEEVVKFMKNAIRLNSRENRVVFVG
ncbi:MAG: hypothetical protein O7G87_24375, partial [bacterium]|nr:hypothetical protein [bacterium]